MEGYAKVTERILQYCKNVDHSKLVYRFKVIPIKMSGFFLNWQTDYKNSLGDEQAQEEPK